MSRVKYSDISFTARLRRKLKVLLGCWTMTKSTSLGNRNSTITASVRQADGNKKPTAGTPHQNGATTPDKVATSHFHINSLRKLLSQCNTFWCNRV